MLNNFEALYQMVNEEKKSRAISNYQFLSEKEFFKIQDQRRIAEIELGYLVKDRTYSDFLNEYKAIDFKLEE